MHRFNNNLALQGMLALLAFALLLVVAAGALRPQGPSDTDPILTVGVHEPQQPVAPPDTRSLEALPVASLGPSLGPPLGPSLHPSLGRRQANKAAQASVLRGTIVKDGSDFVFREQSGLVYRLDAPEKAKLFEGKSVKLSGEVEKDANLIHVQRIERTAA